MRIIMKNLRLKMLDKENMARFGLRLSPIIKCTPERVAELRCISASFLIKILIITKVID
jgi:hypothetical protein